MEREGGTHIDRAADALGGLWYRGILVVNAPVCVEVIVGPICESLDTDPLLKVGLVLPGTASHMFPFDALSASVNRGLELDLPGNSFPIRRFGWHL